MKKLLVQLFTSVLLLFFASDLLSADDKYPRIERIETEDKLFKGYIDSYPITMYLKYSHHSNYFVNSYSVGGWYYYDNIKEKIPLAGIYSYNGLTLYQFNDTTFRDSILDFKITRLNPFDEYSHYVNLDNYQEKFVINGEENYWYSNDKKLEVRLDKDDLSISNTVDYLHIDSTNVVNLHTFGGLSWNFELLAHKPYRYLLQYDHMSNNNVMGRCGAAIEEGYLIIRYDKQYTLTDADYIPFNSCDSEIYVESEREVSPGVTIYQGVNYLKDKNFEMTVDLNKVEVTVVETEMEEK